jgi:hypothetical protein
MRRLDHPNITKFRVSKKKNKTKNKISVVLMFRMWWKLWDTCTLFSSTMFPFFWLVFVLFSLFCLQVH